MSLAEHIVEKQRVFEATGNFTSEQPTVVAELDVAVFTEAQAANIGSSAYRAIGIEDLKTPALTRFRRITGAHSTAAVRGTNLKAYREEPDLRAGIIGPLHWTLAGTEETIPDTRILGPHIDDYFLQASIAYFGTIGQPMLHYPGSYTLDLDRLREEGYEIGEEIFNLWQEKESYRAFAFAARKCEGQLYDLYAQQVESQGIKPVESPSGLIVVTDDHFLHSEGDHSLAVGSFRGIVRRSVTLFEKRK
jgi:hypothetical protein